MDNPLPMLDPRLVPVPTLKGGVSIPFDELPHRLHELPSRSETIRVADVEQAGEAVDWLRAGGRLAQVVPAEFGEPGIRLWRPNRFLTEVVARLASGRGLDLACGTGRDAVSLASQGWSMTAVDLLPDAIDRGIDLERRYRSADAPPIQWVVADVEGRYEPADRFDLITMFRFLSRPLLALAQGWLQPGGSLVVETFTTIHRETHGRPGARHCVSPGELPMLVPELDVMEFDEGWHGDCHMARLWAKRLE